MPAIRSASRRASDRGTVQNDGQCEEVGLRYWMVDCLDSNGVAKAHMIWDSAGGNLNAVSRQTPTSTRKLARPINRRQAVIMAAHSLRKLPMTSAGDRWRLRNVEFSRTAWHVSCRAPSRRAHVVIDAATGELLSVIGGKVREFPRA